MVCPNARVIFNTNPNDATTGEDQALLDGFVHQGADTDHDGIPDLIEDHYAALGYGLSKTNPADAAGDLDADGVTNLQAYNQGWDLVKNLNAYDRDGDGMTDAQEDYWNEIHPGILDKTIFADAVGDADGDGVFNFEEVAMLSDPGWAYSRSQFETGPTDGQLLAWTRAVNSPLFDTGLDVDGNAIPLSVYTNTSDFNENHAPDGYEAWVTYRLGGNAPNVPTCDADDQDGDGMSNEWEHRYHFDLRDASDAGPETGIVSEGMAGSGERGRATTA